MRNVANFLAVFTMVVGVGGCAEFQRSPANPAHPAGAPNAAPIEETAAGTRPLGSIAIKGDEKTEGSSAVESALAWSEKYSRAAEKLVKVQQEKHGLEEKNRQLLVQVAGLQSKLDRAKTELGEANAMLIELHGEMHKWKANVHGIQELNDNAHKAQLDALYKILRLLGGEVPEPTTAPAEKQSSVKKEATSAPAE